MRHHPLQRAWLVPLVVAFGVAGCAESVGVGSYTVTYRANTTGVATIDSITYSNGTGVCFANCNGDSTMVLVSSPSATYSTWLTVPSGSIVEAHLYGSGTAAGTAQFTAVWTTATGALKGDSVTTATTAGTKFTLDIPKRTL
jgi:hypothetical protein